MSQSSYSNFFSFLRTSQIKKFLVFSLLIIDEIKDHLHLHAEFAHKLSSIQLLFGEKNSEQSRNARNELKNCCMSLQSGWKPKFDLERIRKCILIARNKDKYQNLTQNTGNTGKIINSQQEHFKGEHFSVILYSIGQRSDGLETSSNDNCPPKMQTRFGKNTYSRNKVGKIEYLENQNRYRCLVWRITKLKQNPKR